MEPIEMPYLDVMTEPLTYDTATEVAARRGKERNEQLRKVYYERERDALATFDANHTSPWENWIRNRWERQGLTKPREPVEEYAIVALGLGGEAGEAQEHLKKLIRDGKRPGEELLLELGDVLHYVTRIAHLFGWSLRDLMNANAQKLLTRDALDNAPKSE